MALIYHPSIDCFEISSDDLPVTSDLFGDEDLIDDDDDKADQDEIDIDDLIEDGDEEDDPDPLGTFSECND